MFIGSLGDPVKLAAVGMGNIIINLIGTGVFFGLNSGMETLVSQSYGANNLKRCGVILQTGRIIAIIAWIP